MPSITPQYVTVSSGFRASAAITLQRPELPFVIQVPSYNGVSLGVQCAQASDATSAQYASVHGPFGSIGAVTVFSGGAAGGGYSPSVFAPTPYLRLLTATAVTVPLSCTVHPVRQ